eukprot:5527154-Pyramimonas_sp.AAC.1
MALCSGACRVLLVGDQHQLPPHSRDRNTRTARAFFSSMARGAPESVIMLAIQYRMVPAVAREISWA